LARPKRLRRLAYAPPVLFFLPSGNEELTALNDAVTLTMDEFESLRLADLECYSQEQAGRKMGISRATFGRIVESGRSKVARALVHGCRIEISGGAFMFGRGSHLQCPRCRHQQPRGIKKRERVECRRCCLPLQNGEESQQGTSHKS
jgi:predicted DNA-binding protein (UPF0251 family)